MTGLLLAEGVNIGGRSSLTSEISTDDGRERGPCRICIDRNAQGEDREEDQTVLNCHPEQQKQQLHRT